MLAGECVQKFIIERSESHKFKSYKCSAFTTVFGYVLVSWDKTKSMLKINKTDVKSRWFLIKYLPGVDGSRH